LEQEYEFTNSWFDGNKPVWSHILDQLKPNKVLEIGAFEGRSTCFLIEHLGAERDLEIHTIDNWEGGIENKPGGSAEYVMTDVERRFFANTKIARDNSASEISHFVHKGFSDTQLATLMSNNMCGYFDFIYVDGSHQAPDVLLDALLSFKLLRLGGVIAFDDYLWQEKLSYGVDPLRCPKIAIDSFTNIFSRKINILGAPLYQLYVEKLAD